MPYKADPVYISATKAKYFIHQRTCMKKSIFSLIIIALLVSCNNKGNFKLTGTVKDATGDTLYLLYNGLTETIVLDSVKLDENGNFKFSSPKPAYPDFYSLKLKNKTLTFAVDSNETINIETQNTGFASEYNISGSYTSTKIQQLRKSVMAIETKISEARKDKNTETRLAKIDEIKKDIDQHKEMARKLILENPRSAAAYFALYQKVNNTYLFDPYMKEDRVYCAAVATAFNTFMPEYDRTKNIYNLVMDAIKTERQALKKERWDKIVEESGVGYINIRLDDNKNRERNLSELEGNVVLIDFSAYSNRESVAYTFALRELYNKYHNKGLEIFQVSVDNNKLLWEQAVENIPWICVRDTEGANTPYLETFNIRSIPTTFLMNRKGDIIARALSFG